jgi:hypothetical protein
MKWIYPAALALGLYEAITYYEYGPIIFFIGCGITYLAIRDR